MKAGIHRVELSLRFNDPMLRKLSVFPGTLLFNSSLRLHRGGVGSINYPANRKEQTVLEMQTNGIMGREGLAKIINAWPLTDTMSERGKVIELS